MSSPQSALVTHELTRRYVSKPAKPFIAFAAMQMLLLSGCASLELHLAESGCTLDRPITISCPWEVR